MARFEQTISFNSRIVNPNVLREQHLAVVVFGKYSMITAARIDLIKLIDHSVAVIDDPIVIQLHEPIVRNGLVVGYLSGNLIIRPQPR
ncbi:MAG: hypothetical protein SGPRY_011869 [Prymnesium sp.]